ncbi:hypothetical protein [Phenylobacterium sp.]|uniref:hypothetical protein n=1 Tax=Phenylobacterium sp. TaxID=1871053 RepID=UPI002FC7807E
MTSYLQAKGLNVRLILEIAHFFETFDDSRFTGFTVHHESSMTYRRSEDTRVPDPGRPKNFHSTLALSCQPRKYCRSITRALLEATKAGAELMAIFFVGEEMFFGEERLGAAE